MICKKNKLYMIDYLTGSIPDRAKSELTEHIKNCRNCSKELQGLETAHGASLDYFKHVRVPYNNDMEDRLTERIVNESSTVLSFIKGLYFRFSTILRPIVITSTMVFLVLSGIQGYSEFQRNRVINKISGIIGINEEILDFVVLNNMDYVVQLSMQDDTGSKFSDKEDIHAGIKYSLIIYLNSKLNRDYFNKNWDIIDHTLDIYAEEYYNFIKDNPDNILI